MSKQKLPENAKCVYKGKLFDIYNWEQEMFDGSFETFEAVKRCDSVQVIAVTPNKKLIITKEAQPYVGNFLSIPGGRVDKGEGHEEAAKRELLEETGIKSKKLIFWQEKHQGTKLFWSTMYYIAKDCEIVGPATPEEAGEKIDMCEVSLEEFLILVQKDNFRNKQLADMLFRIEHTKGELEKFKALLFDEES